MGSQDDVAHHRAPESKLFPTVSMDYAFIVLAVAFALVLVICGYVNGCVAAMFVPMAGSAAMGPECV